MTRFSAYTACLCVCFMPSKNKIILSYYNIIINVVILAVGDKIEAFLCFFILFL